MQSQSDRQATEADFSLDEAYGGKQCRATDIALFAFRIGASTYLKPDAPNRQMLASCYTADSIV